MEYLIRPVIPDDYDRLAHIINDEWKFYLYSKEYAHRLSKLYLMHVLNGSIAYSLIVDGDVEGVVIIDGGDLDTSLEFQELSDEMDGIQALDQCIEDMECLEGVLHEFESTAGRKDLIELKLVIISKDVKGNGFGRSLMEKASITSLQKGYGGFIFYTDSYCNIGFYDHLNAEIIGHKDIFCMGEDTRVLVYVMDNLFG